jgi:hypothetical protein
MAAGQSMRLAQSCQRDHLLRRPRVQMMPTMNPISAAAMTNFMWIPVA